MRIGVTGHQTLAATDGWYEVDGALRRILIDTTPPLLGVTSLAAGADQRFASLVLQLGGELSVVLPFEGYERAFSGPTDRAAYHRLLGRATHVETLDCQASDQQCFLAAGKRVVDISDQLVAVWDGRPAQGIGGTGDVVGYARSIGRPVILIDVARWR